MKGFDFRNVGLAVLALLLIAYGLGGSGVAGSWLADDDKDGTPNALDPSGTIVTYDVSGSITVDRPLHGYAAGLRIDRNSFKLNPIEKSSLFSMSVSNPMLIWGSIKDVTLTTQLIDNNNLVVVERKNSLGDFGLWDEKTTDFSFSHIQKGTYSIRFFVSYSDQEKDKPTVDLEAEDTTIRNIQIG